jgi:hypothetical protein
MESPVTYDQVVRRLAPCGLDCERCARYKGGTVNRAAADLAAALQGFEAMAARVVDRIPALAGYAGFEEILGVFVAADCAGCRQGEVPLPFCAARTCHREQGVDFCFQCSEYPCDRNQYPGNLAERWRTCNDRMREVGVEQYYQESLERPRY